MNPFRDEMTIKLGGEAILLRPTFENIAAMEAVVGSIGYLGWKYSKGARLQRDHNAPIDLVIKHMPTLTEVSQIIYFNQAATHPDDPTKKRFTLEEIWDMVRMEGVAVTNPIVGYISRIGLGGSKEEKTEETVEEKKS